MWLAVIPPRCEHGGMTAHTSSSPALRLERTGIRQLTARNERGAEVLIGDGPGRFSPGQLLRLALAGCNALSADARLRAALGDDYAESASVTGTYDEDEDRITDLHVELSVDLSGLDQAARAALDAKVHRAIDRSCTVGHTISHPVPHTVALSQR